MRIRTRALYIGILFFVVLDVALYSVYWLGSRRYPFIKACPVKALLCLRGKTLSFSKAKAVGYKLQAGEPFYAVADGVLTNIAVGSGPRLARGYKLYLKNGINVVYIFPRDAKFLPEKTAPNRLSPTLEEFLGRKVKAGEPIGWMGKSRLPRKIYKGVNLLISLEDVGTPYQYPPEKAERKPYKFLPLEVWDLWFR